MKKRSFERLLEAVRSALDPDQLARLGAAVKERIAAHAAETELKRRAETIAERRCCPHCGGESVVKHGRDRLGRQRFRCTARAEGGCGATFNSLTGTPLARMKKAELWRDCAAQMEIHRSVEDIVAVGVAISRTTAWRWRHRFLALPSSLLLARLEGVIEADETFFRSSYKGSRGWKRGAPPENRPPRYRGGPALNRGLSKEQIPVVTAVARDGSAVEAVLADRSDAAVLGDRRRVPRRDRPSAGARRDRRGRASGLSRSARDLRRWTAGFDALMAAAKPAWPAKALAADDKRVLRDLAAVAKGADATALRAVLPAWVARRHALRR